MKVFLFASSGDHRWHFHLNKDPSIRRHRRRSSGSERHRRHRRRRSHSNRPPPPNHIRDNHRLHHRFLEQYQPGENVVRKRPRGRSANDDRLQCWRLPAATLAALLPDKAEVEGLGGLEEREEGGENACYYYGGVCYVLVAVFRDGGAVAGEEGSVRGLRDIAFLVVR